MHRRCRSVESVEKAVQLIEELFARSGVSCECFSPPSLEVVVVTSAPIESPVTAVVGGDGDKLKAKV